jgi:hypothetical protein
MLRFVDCPPIYQESNQMRRSISDAQVGRVNRTPSDFRYFDIGRHWNNVLKPLFESETIQEQLVHDFSKHVKNRERRFNATISNPAHHRTWCYDPAEKPKRWDPSDWRCDRKGRPYSFDEYICYGACHCIVNSLLLAVRIAFPNRPWIIVIGQRHSTVWDQDCTLFDMNYFALKVSPEECAIETVLHPNAEFLGIGELLELA